MPFQLIPYLIVLAISTVISIALMPKQKSNRPQSATIDDFDLPQATEGTPQMVVFGEVWSGGWMVLEYGNLRTRDIAEQGQTIGFRYYMLLHMGICRGPIDALKEIKVGERKAWPLDVTTQTGGGTVRTWVPYNPAVPGTGSYHVSYSEPTYTTVPARDPVVSSEDQVTITAPNLFGGDKKEGGIEGVMDVMMGEDTQPLNPRLVALLGDYVSAFRGVTTILYDGLICSVSPYPKPWGFKLQRALMGWDGDVFYSAKAKVDLTVSEPEVEGGENVDHVIEAMNPAHMIYECITNRDWGRGLSRDFVDEDSFTAAADILFDEGFGLCLAWTREDTIDSFVQTIIDHVVGALYVNRLTGLLTLKLIRADYVVDDLPAFTTRTGILTVEDDDSSTSVTEINEIIVNFNCPIGLGQKRQIRVQNLASIQANEAISSKTIDYLGVPSPQLAARLAHRDLRVHCSSLRRFKLTLDRRAYTLQPGDVFVFSSAERGISSMVMRIAGMEDGEDGRFTVNVLEDIFGMPATTYITPATGVGAPVHAPAPGVNERMVELSYVDLLRVKGVDATATITADQTYVSMQAGEPKNPTSPNFNMLTAVDGSSRTDKGIGGWTAMGILDNSIAPLDDACSINNYTFPSDDLLHPGCPIVVGQEVMRLISIDTATGAVTLNRGCGDTLPQVHSVGSPVFFYEFGGGYDATRYTSGDLVKGQLLTNSSAGQLAVADAEVMSVTTVGRHARPYPPGRAMIETDFIFNSTPISANFTLSWEPRNRLTQGSELVPFENGGITSEAGVTYTVVVKDGATAVRTDSGITGTSWTYNSSNWATDGRPNPLTLELWAVRDGLASWQKYSLDITLRVILLDTGTFTLSGGSLNFASGSVMPLGSGAFTLTGGTAEFRSASVFSLGSGGFELFGGDLDFDEGDPPGLSDFVVSTATDTPPAGDAVDFTVD